MGRQVDIDDVVSALLTKGQSSKRYKLGETWELNFEEIREALDDVPSTIDLHALCTDMVDIEKERDYWHNKSTSYEQTIVLLSQAIAELGTTLSKNPEN